MAKVFSVGLKSETFTELRTYRMKLKCFSLYLESPNLKRVMFSFYLLFRSVTMFSFQVQKIKI